MEWINYHHLLYFWTVVKEGGISRAAEKLRLSQPTVSAQVRLLEAAVGERLFQRHGRTLVPTDTGRVVFRYADEIFQTGREMLQAIQGRHVDGRLHLTVGVANAVPKLIVYRLLRPAAGAAPSVHLVCREDNADQLVSQLAIHALDVVITDTPAAPHLRVRVFNHVLGESDTTFFGPAAVARRFRRRFPHSLQGAPLMLPTANTALRRALDGWFEREGIRPDVVGEFEDSALMKVFGQAAGVLFPAPAAIADDVCRTYGVRVVGRTAGARERYYAITAERRLKHPGVLALTSAAREDLFA